ncbi:MAG: hypothetical protein MK212_20605 [Saprospiraceae bacterium]|nr:hypothetical protein [Saprospiraceae bacterium]
MKRLAYIFTVIALPLYAQEEKAVIEDDLATEVVEEVEDEVEDVDVEWETYTSEEFAIELLFPKGSKIEANSNGDWKVLYAVSPKGVEVHMMASNNHKKDLGNKFYVAKKLGMPAGTFTEVGQSNHNDLSLTVFYAEGIIEPDGYQSAVFAIVGNHDSKGYNYLFTLYTDIKSFEDYREHFIFWYENIKGL